jgi:hypothetical protein
MHLHINTYFLINLYAFAYNINAKAKPETLNKTKKPTP